MVLIALRVASSLEAKDVEFLQLSSGVLQCLLLDFPLWDESVRFRSLNYQEK